MKNTLLALIASTLMFLSCKKESNDYSCPKILKREQECYICVPNTQNIYWYYITTTTGRYKVDEYTYSIKRVGGTYCNP